MYTTAVNAFELYKGAFKARDPKMELARAGALLDAFFFMLALDRDSARSAGAFRHKSNPTGGSDLLIASIALSNKQAIVTQNRMHFEHVPGLEMEQR